MKTNLPVPGSALDVLFMAFQVGHHRCAIPFARVAEVRTLQNSVPVLEAPDYGTGTLLLLGRPAPLLDLRVRLGQSPRFDHDTRLIVIFVRRPGADDMRVVLIVDSIDDVVELAPTCPSRSGDSPAHDAFITTWADINGAPLSVLAVDRLVEKTIVWR